MTASGAGEGRRTSVGVRVGSVTIGGGAPIVVQSMTNTDTEDARATAEQVRALAEAGSEIVRITVNTPEAAAAVPEIRERLEAAGCTRAAGGRLPLQRPPPAHRVSRRVPRRSPSIASTPATSASARSGTASSRP